MRILKTDFFSRIIIDDDGMIKVQRRSQFDFNEFYNEPISKIVTEYIYELLSNKEYYHDKNVAEEYNCKCSQEDGVCVHRR